MTHFQTAKFLFLVSNGISVMANTSIAIVIYIANNEDIIIGWEWPAVATLISVVSFIWILSWKE